MSLVAAPIARPVAGPTTACRSRTSRTNPIRVAPVPSSARRTRSSLTVGAFSPDAAAQAITTHPVLLQLAGNANELVDGCGVNGTCGQVSAPPFALIGGAIVVSAAVLFSVTFGLKVRGGGVCALSRVHGTCMLLLFFNASRVCPHTLYK